MHKRALTIGVILMICGISLAVGSLHSVYQDLHNNGSQELEKGKYYVLDPPEIHGVYFVNSSKLIIHLYPSGVIELFLPENKVTISSYEGEITKIIDLNGSVTLILVYVVDAIGKLLMEYDYHVSCYIRPYAWLAIPATVCSIIGVALSQVSIFIMINTLKSKVMRKMN